MSETAEPKRPRGRPRVTDETRKDVEVVTMRVEGAERRAKFRALGREWLQAAIDKAKLPA